MKLANSGNSLELYTNDFIIAGSRYTRDFKEYPLNPVASISNYDGLYSTNSKVIRFVNSNASVTSNLKRQTAFVYNNIIKSDKTYKAHEIQFLNIRLSRSYNNDFSESYNTSDSTQIASCVLEKTNNFLYTTYNNSSNTSAWGDRKGFAINNLKNITTNGTVPSFYMYGDSSNYGNNESDEFRIIKSTSEKDIIALDFNRGCGAGSCNGNSTTYITNVNATRLGMQNVYRGNNFAIFSVDALSESGYQTTGKVFTKTVSGEDWTTESVTTTSAVYFDTVPSNAIDNTDGTMTMYLTRPYISTQQKLGIWKIVIDLENETYTTQDLTLDEAIPYEVITMAQRSTNAKLYRAYATEYYRDEEDRCFVTVICKAINNNPTFVKVMCYEVDETNNTATLLGTYTPADGNLQEYDMINGETMLIGSPLGYIILTLDKDNGWIQTVSKEIAIDEITYDATANALFYTDTAKNIYMDKLDLAMSADWGWSEEGLEWLGEPIHTSLYMSCKDYTGDLVAQSVKLYIDGNAVFDSTSTKEAEVLTTTTGPITIPVTITGEGTITVSAKALVQ